MRTKHEKKFDTKFDKSNPLIRLALYAFTIFLSNFESKKSIENPGEKFEIKNISFKWNFYPGF